MSFRGSPEETGIPETLVRKHVEQLQANPIFLRAGYVSKLLRFIVEQTLSGNAASLREKEIAYQLFTKDPADFQPGEDSVVRATARRLRNALREYYASHPDEEVVISLQKGTYVPVFHLVGSDRRGTAVDERSASEDVRVTQVLHLRREGRPLSANQAKVMVIQHDFYCAEWNESGEGIAHGYKVQVFDEVFVVLDQATGLMWEKSGAAEWFTFHKAKERVSTLNAGRSAGFDDWRVPTLEEAMSLLTPKSRGRQIELVSGDDRYVRLVHLDSVFEEQYAMWTSDVYANDPDHGWVVLFLGGSCGIERQHVNVSVRAVRSMN